MNKKVLIGGIVVVLVIVLGLLIAKAPKGNLGAQSPRATLLETVTHTATTTHSSLPVKVMSTSTSRSYGLIVNDSATDIYIYLKSFQNPMAASTTVQINKGIRVNSGGGSYELLNDNLYIGEVWATSTAPNLKILITEF